MNQLHFGTGGIPLSTKIITTPEGQKLSGRESGIHRIKELGLNHMEVEFVHGVRITEKNAVELGKLAKKENISLTIHGSYYINLASLEKNKRHASINRVTKALWAGCLMQAKSITFHAAFYQGRKHQDIKNTISNAILEALKALKDMPNHPKEDIPLISPETTGKTSQWGTVDEILDIADSINQKLGYFASSICLDFAHIHARSNGKYNTYEEFVSVLTQIGNKLGKQALKNLHMHISGIEYGPKGEKRHLPLKESDLRFREALKALKDLNIQGWITCESPILEDDAILLRQHYESTPYSK